MTMTRSWNGPRDAWTTKAMRSARNGPGQLPSVPDSIERSSPRNPATRSTASVELKAALLPSGRRARIRCPVAIATRPLRNTPIARPSTHGRRVPSNPHSHTCSRSPVRPSERKRVWPSHATPTEAAGIATAAVEGRPSPLGMARMQIGPAVARSTHSPTPREKKLCGRRASTIRAPREEHELAAERLAPSADGTTTGAAIEIAATVTNSARENISDDGECGDEGRDHGRENDDRPQRRRDSNHAVGMSSRRRRPPGDRAREKRGDVGPAVGQAHREGDPRRGAEGAEYEVEVEGHREGPGEHSGSHDGTKGKCAGPEMPHPFPRYLPPQIGQPHFSPRAFVKSGHQRHRDDERCRHRPPHGATRGMSRKCDAARPGQDADAEHADPPYERSRSLTRDPHGVADRKERVAPSGRGELRQRRQASDGNGCGYQCCRHVSIVGGGPQSAVPLRWTHAASAVPVMSPAGAVPRGFEHVHLFEPTVQHHQSQ